MEASRGTAYGLCFSQILITIGVVTYSPIVEVHLFTADVHLNATLLCNGLSSTRVEMPLAFIGCSALVVFFCTVTMGLSERGVSDYEYGEQSIEDTGMWDLNFTLYVYLAHMVMAAVVSTPGDAYQVLISGVFMAYFLLNSCAPKSDRNSFVKENINCVGYVFGVWLVIHACADPRRMYTLCAFIILDYFLGVGHLWERPVMMNTVINCRLFYVCASSLALSFTYAAWPR